MKYYKIKWKAMVLLLLFWSSIHVHASMPDLKGHWAETMLYDLQKEGLVNGYADGNFLPDKEITRAEFVASINKMLGFNQPADINFRDVKPEEWYAKEIAVAVGQGYVKGYHDGTFRPNDTVRRIEAAVLLARVNQLPTAEDKGNLRDEHGIPHWAREEVNAVVAAGIMRGYPDNTFQGDKKIKRAEAIVSVARAREVKEEMEKSTLSEKPEKQAKEQPAPAKKQPNPVAKAILPASPQLPPMFLPQPPAIEPKPQPILPQPQPQPQPILPKRQPQSEPSQPKPEDAPIEAAPSPLPEKELPKEELPPKKKEPAQKKNIRKKENTKTANNLELIASHENTAVYEMDGQTRTILWAKGLQAPIMGESGDFHREINEGYIDYKANYVPNHGWYDVNKMKEGEGDISIDINLCYGAVASNMLHWWFEQNDGYIRRYLRIKEKQGAFPDKIAPLIDYRRYVNSFHSQSESEIFKYFKVHFGSRSNGYQADLLMDMFLNGYKAKENGGMNDSSWDKGGVDQNGGFFYDVFGDTKLTERGYRGDYQNFGNDIAKFLTSGKTIGIEHHTGRRHSTHIVTIWGAEYDEQGNIQAIYIADSDDQYETNPVGMKRFAVKNIDGLAKLSNRPDLVGGSEIDNLHTLRLGTKEWEAYFAREEIRQIEAEIEAATQGAVVEP